MDFFSKVLNKKETASLRLIKAKNLINYPIVTLLVILQIIVNVQRYVAVNAGK